MSVVCRFRNIWNDSGNYSRMAVAMSATVK
jgi:hypothetical protein